MRDVLVLCYHAVSPTWEADLSITPESLERQVDHLIRRGWRAVTFTEAVLGASPGRVMAITFDDAFASVKGYAAPILQRLGAPATVFAPTAFMSGGMQLTWVGIEHWEGTVSAHELAAMDWTDLGRLAELGWEIGSHTRTHPRLTKLDPGAQEIELRRSREECTERLGRPCRTIAYPYGDVHGGVVAATKAAGYDAGARLSSDLRQHGPYLCPRVGIYHTDSWARFRLKVSHAVRISRASPGWRLIQA